MENSKKKDQGRLLSKKDFPRKAITGKVRFSYANVWAPKAISGGEEKYSVSLIIPKSDMETLKDIKSAIEAAAREGKGRFGGSIPEGLKLPLRDGDMERPEDEAYRDSFFLNAASRNKPEIVDIHKKPILDQSLFYSGCYGKASVIFYPYNIDGNRGIGCCLGNLQKLSDGEPLTGRISAEEDFEDEDFDFLG